MARRQALTPGKAALLMLGVGTLALMGLPGFGPDAPPAGALAGVVLDPSGDTLSGVEVALFDGQTLELVELAKSDALGRFAFQHAPWNHHVFANPAASTGLVPRWELDRERSDPGVLELGLDAGTPTTITVTDEAGAVLPRAEVRVIDGHDDAVVARVMTDAAGRATVVLPDEYHLGVLAADENLAPHWIYAATPSSSELAVALEAGRWIEGRVVSSDGDPLAGLVVSAWNRSNGDWRWLGYDLARADGSFALLGTGATHLRALDPEQAVLPGAWNVDALEGPLELLLDPGEPLLMRIEGDSPASRVWVYDELRGLWSWGSATDAGGSLAVQTAERVTIHAEPLDGRGAALEESVTREPGAPLVLGKRE
ncbi:MAG: carboxypeptidase-like regulatory domain-containing protein [Planctomycetota bacterium]